MACHQVAEKSRFISESNESAVTDSRPQSVIAGPLQFEGCCDHLRICRQQGPVGKYLVESLHNFSGTGDDLIANPQNRGCRLTGPFAYHRYMRSGQQ